MKKRNKTCYQEDAPLSRHSLSLHRNFFCLVVLVCLCWENDPISSCASLHALRQNRLPWPMSPTVTLKSLRHLSM